MPRFQAVACLNGLLVDLRPPILSLEGIGLKGNLRHVLERERESGSNDPMAYFLTVSLTAIISTGSTDFAELIPSFFKQFILGGA